MCISVNVPLMVGLYSYKFLVTSLYIHTCNCSNLTVLVSAYGVDIVRFSSSALF